MTKKVRNTISYVLGENHKLPQKFSDFNKREKMEMDIRYAIENFF